jgi:hypothetical protein
MRPFEDRALSELRYKCPKCEMEEPARERTVVFKRELKKAAAYVLEEW